MKIFLCSTAHDLYDFRAFIVHLLEERKHQVLYHESPTFPARFGLHSHDQCLEAVKDSDVVLCIIDRRYGGIYAGKQQFPDQVFEISARSENGVVASSEVKVPSDKLSITWCELITAYENRIPVITFVRQKTFDEKYTRRKNQALASFQPAYAEKNEVFDLIDWITKRNQNNWIAQFNSIVDFRDKLIAWISELERSISTPPPSGLEVSGPDSSRLDTPEPNAHGSGSDSLQREPTTGGANNPALSTPGATLPSLSRLPERPEYRIGVIVEGAIDRLVVTYLIRKLRLKNYFAVIPHYGRYSAQRRLKDLFDEYAPLFDHTFVLFDSDAANEQQYEQTKQNVHEIIRDTLQSKIEVFFADPEIESWLVAGMAPDVYKRHLGQVNKKIFTSVFPTKPFDARMLDTKFDLHTAMSLCSELRDFVKRLMEVDVSLENGVIPPADQSLIHSQEDVSSSHSDKGNTLQRPDGL